MSFVKRFFTLYQYRSESEWEPIVGCGYEFVTEIELDAEESILS